MLSEASYVYILSGQKLIENAKNGLLWRDFENLGQTVLPERVLFSFQTICDVRVPKCSPVVYTWKMLHQWTEREQMALNQSIFLSLKSY